MIFAVKDDFHDTIARLRQLAFSSGNSSENDTQRASSGVALSLASQPTIIKREESTEHDSMLTLFGERTKVPALYRWAVNYRHTALVALLLPELITWSGELLREADPDEDRESLFQGTIRYINVIESEETAQLLLDSCLGGPSRDERESEALLQSGRVWQELVIHRLLRRNKALKKNLKMAITQSTLQRLMDILALCENSWS